MGRNGQIAWNKGIKTGYFPWNKGKSHLKNEDNPNWKGNNISYSGLHSCLYRNFKKSGNCNLCSKINTYTECALRKGYEYKREINNFIELCKNCHNKYDELYRYGSNHHNSILKESDIVKIRNMYKGGEKQVNIALIFNVTNSNINMIIKRKAWKHIP